MAELPQLLYIVVVDDADGHPAGEDAASATAAEAAEGESFRYTRSVLQSTLQLMGCKGRHAFKISRRVFDVLRNEHSTDDSFWHAPDPSRSTILPDYSAGGGGGNGNQAGRIGRGKATPKFLRQDSSAMRFELYKRRTTVVISREKFVSVVCDALSLYNYVGPNQRSDLLLACRIRERNESVTILLCGTSGCGKSTLSSLLGSRLGITTVISTDSIRHMMRSFVDEKQNPLLWASTYHAGECLDPVEVAKAKAKRKAKKLVALNAIIGEKNELLIEKDDNRSSDLLNNYEVIGRKQMAIEGYKAQSEMVIDSLDRLITAWEDRKESVVVEGVHLSLNFVMGLMKKHPSIIPFMIYISNEDKHLERFAVRAKYMTLDPRKNKYVKYIRNIRAIQEYLSKRADKHVVPKINNTNVDKSVAAIHATVFSCLRRLAAGEPLYDPLTKTVSVIDKEYRNQCAANSLSSKGMFQLIQRLGSSRHLMALLNTDGSVVKAWPFGSADGNGLSSSGDGGVKCLGTPLYGPLHIGKAEPINLQFGQYGISAWPSDTGGTSHAGSFDDLRLDGADSGSRHVSSCCSSPKMSDGPAKELKEDLSVSGSDEEAEFPSDSSDEDLNDIPFDFHEEMEGSIDEDSAEFDDVYEDLTMQDDKERRYGRDDGDDLISIKRSDQKLIVVNRTEIWGVEHKHQHKVGLLPTISDSVAELPSFGERIKNVKMRKRSLSDNARLRNQSKGVPSFGKSESFCWNRVVPVADESRLV